MTYNVLLVHSQAAIKQIFYLLTVKLSVSLFLVFSYSARKQIRIFPPKMSNYWSFLNVCRTVLLRKPMKHENIRREN